MVIRWAGYLQMIAKQKRENNLLHQIEHTVAQY